MKLFVFFLSFALVSPAWAGDCRVLYGRLLKGKVVHKTGSLEGYHESKHIYEGRASGDVWELFLERSRAEGFGGLEELLAAMDVALVQSPRDYSWAVGELGKVVYKPFWIGQLPFLKPREPRRKGRRGVKVPRRLPETQVDVASLVDSLNMALMEIRVDQVARTYRTLPGLSWPMLNSTRSYTRWTTKRLAEQEARYYEMLHALERSVEGFEHRLAEHRITRKRDFISLAARLVWPFYYRPLSRFEASLSHYQTWREKGIEGLETILYQKLSTRLQAKWFLDNYLRGILLLGSVSSAVVFFQTDWSDLSVEELKKKFDGISKRLISENREEIRETFREFSQPSQEIVDEAEEFLLNFYAEEIRTLEERIAEEGDPRGKLAKKIASLKERRDSELSHRLQAN